MWRSFLFCIFSVLCAVLAACYDAVPSRVDNACVIFAERPSWYWASLDVQRRWGVPLSVQLAIIHQESRFRAQAQPSRTTLWGGIPWQRRSTALGYAQALDVTWHRYCQERRRWSASRINYADAVDFIGWYAHDAHRRAGVDLSDAEQMYLAYHEGVNGYKRRSFHNKLALQHVATSVREQAWRYHQQLVVCLHDLPKKPWWRFW